MGQELGKEPDNVYPAYDLPRRPLQYCREDSYSPPGECYCRQSTVCTIQKLYSSGSVFKLLRSFSASCLVIPRAFAAISTGVPRPVNKTVNVSVDESNNNNANNSVVVDHVVCSVVHLGSPHEMQLHHILGSVNGMCPAIKHKCRAGQGFVPGE